MHFYQLLSVSAGLNWYHFLPVAWQKVISASRKPALAINYIKFDQIYHESGLVLGGKQNTLNSHIKDYRCVLHFKCYRKSFQLLLNLIKRIP